MEFIKLTLNETRFLLLAAGFATRFERKLYPFRDTVLRRGAMTRTAFGAAKVSCVRKGYVCFARGFESRSSDTMWLARTKPWDFAVDTSGPEFEEYRRCLQPGARLSPVSNRGWFTSGMDKRRTKRDGRERTRETGREPSRCPGRENTDANAKAPTERASSLDGQHSLEHGLEQERLPPMALRATAEAGIEKLEKATAEELPAAHSEAASVKVRARDLLDHHCRNYQRHLGQEYVVENGKDHSLSAHLSKYRSLEDLKLMNDLFFTLDDDFLVDNGHTFGLFVSRVHALTVQLVRSRRPVLGSAPTTGQPAIGSLEVVKKTSTQIIFRRRTANGWEKVIKPRNPPPSNRAAESEVPPDWSEDLDYGA